MQKQTIGATSGSVIRSHLTITGAVAGVSILASSFVVAPPDSNCARTEVRAVQLAAFAPRISTMVHPGPAAPSPTAVALIPLDLDPATDVAAASQRVHNAALVTTNADGDIEDIFGQLGAFVGGWALLIGFVALAAVAVIFVAPWNFITGLVEQLFTPQAATLVAPTAKRDTNGQAATSGQPEPIATTTASPLPRHSGRATAASTARVDAPTVTTDSDLAATPSISGAAKPLVHAAAPRVVRHGSRAAGDQQRSPVHSQADSAGPSAKGSGPSRHGSAKSSD